jgi:hypothetical protein
MVGGSRHSSSHCCPPPDVTFHGRLDDPCALGGDSALQEAHQQGRQSAESTTRPPRVHSPGPAAQRAPPIRTCVRPSCAALRPMTLVGFLLGRSVAHGLFLDHQESSNDRTDAVEVPREHPSRQHTGHSVTLRASVPTHPAQDRPLRKRRGQCERNHIAAAHAVALKAHTPIATSRLSASRTPLRPSIIDIWHQIRRPAPWRPTLPVDKLHPAGSFPAWGGAFGPPKALRSASFIHSRPAGPTKMQTQKDVARKARSPPPRGLRGTVSSAEVELLSHPQRVRAGNGLFDSNGMRANNPESIAARFPPRELRYGSKYRV